MAYKLDPKNKYGSFLSKGYELYLKKMYKGKESVKTVKVVTKEVPAGKTVKELKAMGLLIGEDQTASPLMDPERGKYDPMGLLGDSEIKTEPIEESAPAPEEKAPEATEVPEIKKAETLFWQSNSINSNIAEDLDYVKYRRAETKRIKDWSRGDRVSEFLVGENDGIDYIRDPSVYEFRANTITLKQDQITYNYQFNREYKEAVYTNSIWFTDVEDKLSRVFYHLSKKWLPDIESTYISLCGAAPSTSLRVGFHDDRVDASSTMAYVTGDAKRMHINLKYFREVENGQILPRDQITDGGFSDWFDKTIFHEIHHQWSNKFISNIDFDSSIPNDTKKAFIEGFAELWQGGRYRQTEGVRARIDPQLGLSRVDGIGEVEVSLNRYFNKAFKAGRDFSYVGGYYAALFLAKRMHDNGKYILDFYKELNAEFPLKNGKTAFDVLQKYIWQYRSINDFKTDFTANCAEVSYDLLLASLNIGETINIESSLIGGQGSPQDLKNLVEDFPDITRVQPDGQNLFNDPSLKKSIDSVIAPSLNQMIYFCEDVQESNIANFKELFTIERIKELYCIVMTDQPIETSTGIKVYQVGSNESFTEERVGQKTLYTIGVNYKNTYTQVEADDELVKVLNMIPKTVKEYKKPIKEMALGNLLISQTLA